ncbi:ATPase family AAA domain-containing protein 3 [Cytospora mali]|uniref:ATPase family AAA domain-containing protein 3 n=1 Tax=Cytospora mali TaxID=578113 RepID=A0A194VEU2_CYTMA|nr:ATPase family AAA domain-containing protein 3 [Valsa mali var. pyri (nom. inval.)]
MSASEDMGVTPSGTEPGGPLTVKTVRSLGIQERIPPAGEVVKITENEGPVQANSAQEPLEEPGSIEGKGPWNEGTVASEVQPTLFCPKERISHVWMVISGKTACSSCKQKLLLDREFEARASDLGTPTKDKSQKAQEDGQFISHFVAYLDDGGEQITKFEGRIYVDLASYYAEEQGVAPEVGEVDDMGEGLAVCTCEECKGWRPHPHPSFRWAQYDVLDPVQERDLVLKDSPEGPRHRYLLCNWVLAGFILKSRTWECLDVANCLAPKANSRAMDTLVMPTERKDMIKALIQKFSTASTPSKTWGADFVENKGEGQIFLLHGSPGVGKTYTAECIAEYTGRALLSLTCADFGIDEERMEQQLSKWFRLAEKWGAVMLIDEADVFLERRHVSDLKRNSLVSVFLRCIEYYRGFLFLTTNRVGHFDDALISRIHVIIRYDNLGEKERNKIWTQFFDKLSDERENFRIMGRAKAYVLEDDIMRRMEWNGREIRNVFQTAVALAEYRFSQKEHKTKDDHPTLDQKDFEQVCQMTRQFKEYLVNIHGIDEEARAFHHKDRAGYGHAL